MPTTPIDAHIGRMIRQRRKAMDLTQSDLADHLGLTFQQVQKYGRGVNRVSVAMLVKIAVRLKTDLAFFVQDFVVMVTTDASPKLAPALEWLASDQAMVMAYDMSRLDKASRLIVTALASELVAVLRARDEQASGVGFRQSVVGADGERIDVTAVG